MLSWRGVGSTRSFQFFSSHPGGSWSAPPPTAEFAEHGWDADSVPDPCDPATFRRSKLGWAETGKPEHAELQDLPT